MTGSVSLGLSSVTVGMVAAANQASDQVLHWGGVIAVILAVGSGLWSVRLKTNLEAAEGSARAWEGERDAAVAKASRLEKDLIAAEADRRALAARTDLTELRAQMTEQHTALLVAVKEVAAAVRATNGHTG